MDKLKPCLICEEDEDCNLTVFNQDEDACMTCNGIPDFKYFYIKCLGCGASTGRYDTKQEAINSWNRRVSDE